MKKRVKQFRFFTSLVIISISLFACEANKKKAKVIPGDDTVNSGVIHISVDESFAPIIDEQIKVFMSQNPKTKIIPHYKPEAECLKDLLSDSTRMVIVTRGLTATEELFYKDTLSFIFLDHSLSQVMFPLLVSKAHGLTY